MPSPLHLANLMDATTCYHCALPIPNGVNLQVTIDGIDRQMCCPGCQAVAEAIVEANLTSYYRHRTEAGNSGQTLVPDILLDTEIYNHPSIQKTFVHEIAGNLREANLILEDVHCAACVWLNEQAISSLDGVESVQVNYTTRRAQVRWDNDRIQLSEILSAIQSIGYQAHPYEPSQQRILMEREKKNSLKRIGVAAVLGMQVMILAVAMYAGHWWGIESEFNELFRRLSMILTLPVLLYSATPFFQGAWRDILRRHAGMDVPVSLGILIAFIASLWATLTGQGEVYYDSVVMFVFLLLTARHMESAARRKSADAADRLIQTAPATATRLNKSTSAQELIPVAELEPGDLVLIRPGEVIPADGRLIKGSTSIDESLLTGEHLPLFREPGADLIGGSLNVEQPITLEIEKTGTDAVLFGLVQLLDRAQSERPELPGIIDRLSGWFVTAVLFFAAANIVFRWDQGIQQWLPITLSVLVVACPCALSLATPAAIAAATGRLFRHGILVTRSSALENLAKATHVLFDKTGTLTTGELSLSGTLPTASYTAEEAIQLAASLEQYSEHPIAKALVKTAPRVPEVAQDICNTPGSGITGGINGQTYCIGTSGFVSKACRVTIMPPDLDAETSITRVYLATENQLIAGFQLRDTPRPEASSLIAHLKSSGRVTTMLTGDTREAAAPIARQLEIQTIETNLLPEQKLSYVSGLQAQGHIVAMVGDGINDAPVLGAAQVSIAMGEAAPLAASSADMLLLSNNLGHLKDGFQLAGKTRQIIKQNIFWAIGYNLLAIPAALLGYVPPWLAAIGMSASSLIVVANALRLTRYQFRGD